MRWESAGEGDYTRRAGPTRTRAAPTSSCTCGRTRTNCCRARRCATILRKYSDHITVPDPDEEGAVGRRRARAGRSPTRTSRSTRRRRSGRGRSRRSPRSSTTSSTSTSRTTSSRRWPTRHAKVEGRQEYTQLLFIPQRAPFDLWDREHRHGIKLYVRRVFIMDDAEQLMPAYLRFVRGVIDSNDLPLNVSREILQQSRDVETIRAASVKRVLGAARRSRRATPGEVRRRSGRSSAACSRKASPRTPATRTASPSCCASPRRTTTRDEQTVSLADYVGRMKEGQDAIYYITADGFAGGQEQPAPRDLPQARRRSAADVRPGRRVGGRRR